MGTSTDQRMRRIHMVMRQALLMIVAVIEREYGLQARGGPRVRVEILDDTPPPGDDERITRT